MHTTQLGGNELRKPFLSPDPCSVLLAHLLEVLYMDSLYDIFTLDQARV